MKNNKKNPRKIDNFLIILHKYPFAILITTAILLVVFWFFPQKLIASGEEGIFFYNPGLTMHLFSSPWYEVVTGMPMPVLLPRITLLFLPFLLTNVLAIPSWVSQAMIVFLILCTGLIGMYLLAKKLLKDFSDNFTFLMVAIFYLFNLYTLSQIMGRLLFTGIILWAYVPLFILLYIFWIQKKELKYLVYFSFSSFAFSYVYGMPSNIIVLWVSPIIWTIILFISKKFDFKLLLYSGLAIVSWVLVNIWWIFPYVKLSNTAFTTIANNSSSFFSLKGVSAYFPSNQIFLLRQSFLFQNAYFGWYNQPWVILISIFIAFIVVIGIIRSSRRKSWIFLLSLLFIGWFVSKGTNFPFGRTFFYILFTKLTFMQVFRNSYEKFGIIFMIPYSFFFALGVEDIVRNVSLFKRIKQFVFIGIVVFSCLVLSWPLITGDVFGAGIVNARIHVPEYYKQANKYINSKGQGKILMLPMIPGDGIKYLWVNGNYQGIEPSEALFNHPAISKIVRLNVVDDKYTQLYNAMITRQPYSDIFNEMNIRYIVLHNDIDSKVSGASTSAEIKFLIEKNNEIKFLKSYGLLDLYEFVNPRAQELFDISPKGATSISYKELSKTHFSVSIKNATNPYIIIFKETFNPLWVARIGEVIVKDHLIFYNYANGWKINKMGTYKIDITLKVWPWE